MIVCVWYALLLFSVPMATSQSYSKHTLLHITYILYIIHYYTILGAAISVSNMRWYSYILNSMAQ